MSEYDLDSERLELSVSPRNFSLASVELVLRRRSHLRAASAFAQTLVVLVAAVATFLFDLDDFSDRVLVCVVLLLVVTGIGSSVQAVRERAVNR